MNRIFDILKTVSRISLKTLGYLFLALLLTLLVVFLLYWQTNLVAEAVENYLNGKLAETAKIEYGSIKGNLFTEVEIDSLSFEKFDDFKIETKDIRISYSLWSLLNNQIKINSVHSEQINFYLYASSRETPEDKKQYPLDSLLYDLENNNLVDSILVQIPFFELNDFEVTLANIEINNASNRFEDIYLRFSARHNPDELYFSLQKLSGFWKEKDINLKQFRFDLIGKEKQLTINKFRIETDESYLELIADIELDSIPRLAFFADQINIAGSDINKIAGQEILKGSVDGSFSLIGQPLNFTLQVNARGAYDLYDIDKLQADVTYDYGEIKVDTLSLRSNIVNLDLSGDIVQKKSAFGFLTFNSLNLNKISSDLARSNINGELFFNISNFNLKAPTGMGQLIINNTVYDTLKLDSLRFGLFASSGDYSIIEPSFIKFANQALFNLAGEVKRNKNISLTLNNENGNLNNLMSALGVDSLDGIFSTTFTAKGNLFDPDIRGQFEIVDFTYPDVALDSIAFDVDLKKVLSAREGHSNFFIDSGVVLDIPFNDIVINALVDSNKILINRAQALNKKNSFRFSSQVIFEDEKITSRIPFMRVEYENYWLQNDSTIVLQIDSLEVLLNKMKFLGPENTSLTAYGKWDRALNDYNGKIELDNVNLQPFNQFMPEGDQISGSLTGNVLVNSISVNPNADVLIAGKDLTYNDVKIGDLDLEVAFSDSTLSAKKIYLTDGKAKVELSGDLAFDFRKKASQLFDLFRNMKTDLRLAFSDIDLSKYYKLYKTKKPLAGLINGLLEVEGTFNEPYMRQNLRLENFKYQKFNIDSLVMFSQYSSGYLILDSLSTVFNGTSLSAKGWQQLDLSFSADDSVLWDNPLNIVVSSTDDSIGFLGLFNDQVESITGPYEMNVTVAGTPEKLAITDGNINLENGHIVLSRVRDPIKKVNFTSTIADCVMIIEDFSGSSVAKKDFWQKAYKFISQLWTWLTEDNVKDGIASIDGQIKLNDIRQPKVDLNIKTNTFYVNYFIENTEITLTTRDLNIKGRDTLNLTGKITLESGDYGFDLNTLQKNIYLSKPEIEISKPYITMNLEIEIPGNFMINSALDLTNTFRIELSGNLNVTQRAGKSDVIPIGSMELESGKVNFLNQSFVVSSGSINFTNPNELNPDLNIVARKVSRDKIFEIIITGNLENINQNIVVKDSQTGQEIAMSRQDKIAMLALGADASEITSNTNSTLQDLGEDIAATSLLSYAERGAESLTGLDKVEFDVKKFKLNSGLGNTSVAFGKYFTNDLYVEYRTQLGAFLPRPEADYESGDRLGLQYRIDKNWSLESYYERLRSTADLSTQKVQLGLSWELTF